MRKLILSAITAAGLMASSGAALASGGGEPLMKPGFSWEGFFGRYDQAQLKRGFEIFNQVCSNCHGLRLVAYRNLAAVGLTEDEAKKQGIKVEKGVFPWAASGRAIANGRDEGFTKLIFDAETHRILGGSIVGTHAGDLISELALAVEMGADVVDIAKTIHPHPTLGESVGMAAEVAEGVCTDLPPMKKK